MEPEAYTSTSLASDVNTGLRHDDDGGSSDGRGN